MRQRRRLASDSRIWENDESRTRTLPKTKRSPPTGTVLISATQLGAPSLRQAGASSVWRQLAWTHQFLPILPGESCSVAPVTVAAIALAWVAIRKIWVNRESTDWSTLLRKRFFNSIASSLMLKRYGDFGREFTAGRLKR